MCHFIARPHQAIGTHVATGLACRIGQDVGGLERHFGNSRIVSFMAVLALRATS